MRIKSSKTSLKNCTKRSVLRPNKLTNCHTKCSCHRTITDPKSTIICCQSKQRRTRLVSQSVLLTRWSTFQWCQKCQRNCCSWCFTSTKGKLSSIWLLRNWWWTHGGITISSRSGWRETARQISTLIMSMRREIITAMVLN